MATFLRLLNFWDKEKYYYSYIEKSFSSPNYNRDKEINMDKDPYVSQYLIINNYLNLKLKLDQIVTKITKAKEKIAEINSEKILKSNNLSRNESSIEINKGSLSHLNKDIKNRLRERQKSSLRGRIKKYHEEIQKLTKENFNINYELQKLENELNINKDLLKSLNLNYKNNIN